MYLTDVELKNFRVYQGDHVLSFTPPSPRKNVALLGGLNGAGKTSLFSAIVLGFYGKEAAGLLFTRGHNDNLLRAYKRHLEESFSFGARAKGENEMYVKLGLVHQGVELRIQRMWWFDDAGQLEDESLVIYEGSRPLLVEAETEEERRKILQEYIEGLAPARVAKFFFFDGEEIKRIAARDPDQAVIDGLNQLLGFQALRKLVDELYTLQVTFWNALRRVIPEIRRATDADPSEEVAGGYRTLEGGHLLFRPVAQKAFAAAARVLMDRGRTVKNAVATLGRLPMQLRDAAWVHVFWDPIGAKVLQPKPALAQNLILYLVDESPFPAGYDLIGRYRSAVKNSRARLPRRRP